MDSQPDSGLRVDAVWDIETQGWDRFVCGSLWTRASGTVVMWSEDEFARALLELPKGTTAWAHAGGTFDVLWLLDWLLRAGERPPATITMSGSSIASFAISGGPRFRDSARLMPMSLAQASTMFDGQRTKMELDLPCTCGEDCGGYCSISPNLPARQANRLRDYLVCDVEALRDTLDGLAAFALKNNIHLGGTVASSSWNTAKEFCQLEDAVWSSGMYRFVREGYKGGRVEVGITEAPIIKGWDRTQAYPAAMCKPLPCGEPKRLDRKGSEKAYNAGKPGVYEAYVTVPEQHTGMLPVQLHSRIAYPWGKVYGHWHRDELRRAEERGARIEQFVESVVWPEEKPFLKPYMQRCFELREAAETKALKTWLKFLANSLSGAFATGPEREVISIGDFADDDRYTPVGRHTWIWSRPIYQISGRAHVGLAGALTTDARVELDRQIEHAGEAWAYSDTDSCKATRELTRNVGTGLGVWKYEGEGEGWECLAPKVYSYKQDGEREARAKGIRDAVENWDDIRSGAKVTTTRGVNTFKIAVRGDKLFQRRNTHRHVTPDPRWCGARIRVGTGTRTPHVDELKELET